MANTLDKLISRLDKIMRRIGELESRSLEINKAKHKREKYFLKRFSDATVQYHAVHII